jgi:pSer/pThr/pTyr-binding forkhead associated (FHA) protein
LVRYLGKVIHQQFVLEHSTTTIGREMGNVVQIVDSGVSKQHAVMHDEGDRWVVEDLGSKNGVFVNGKRTKKPTKLKHGDKIGFGPIEFVFETASTSDGWDSMHVIDVSKRSSDGTIQKGPAEGTGKRRWF